MGTTHVLLVDDNETFLYTGRELLLRQRSTFVVDTVPNAEQALFAIRTHDYDVVVSDIQLPRLDGIALLYECHAIRPDTPVILIKRVWRPETRGRSGPAGRICFSSQTGRRRHVLCSRESGSGTGATSSPTGAGFGTR
jgi:CheY-like chemotaxis protein